MVAGLTDDTTNQSKDVVLTQKQAGWQDTTITEIGGVKIAGNTALSGVDSGKTITVSFDKANNTRSFAIK